MALLIVMQVAWIETSPPIAALWGKNTLELHAEDGVRVIAKAELGGLRPQAILRDGALLGIVTARAIWGLDLAELGEASPRRLARRQRRDRKAIRALWDRLGDGDELTDALDEAKGIDQALLDSGLDELEEETLDSELDRVQGWFADPNAPWFIEHHDGALFEVWELASGEARPRLVWIDDVEVSLENYARAVVRAHEPALYLFFEDPSHGRFNSTDAYRVALDAPRPRATRLRDPSQIGAFVMSPRGPFVALHQSSEPTYAHAPHLDELNCTRVAPVADGDPWTRNLMVASRQLDAQVDWGLDDPPAEAPSERDPTWLRETRFSDGGDALLARFMVAGTPQLLVLDLRSGAVAHMLVGQAATESALVDPRASVVATPWGGGTWVRDRHGRHWLPFPIDSLTSAGDGKHWLISTPKATIAWSIRRNAELARWPRASGADPRPAPEFASISPDARALLTLGPEGEVSLTPLPPLPSQPKADARPEGASTFILWALERLTKTANTGLELERWFERFFDSEHLAAKLMASGQYPTALVDRPPSSGALRDRAALVASRLKPPHGRVPDVDLVAACLERCDAHPIASDRPEMEASLLVHLGVGVDMMEDEEEPRAHDSAALSRAHRELVDGGALADLPARAPQILRLLRRAIEDPSSSADVALALAVLNAASSDLTGALNDALNDDALRGALQLEQYGERASRALITALLDQGGVQFVSGVDPTVVLPHVAASIHRDEPARRRATALIERLLEHEAVDEVYVSDDDLAALIDATLPPH